MVKAFWGMTFPTDENVICTTIRNTNRLMATLNRDAARIMRDHDLNACTDATGFVLLGLPAESVNGSGVSAMIVSSQVPLIPEGREFGLSDTGRY